MFKRILILAEKRPYIFSIIAMIFLIAVILTAFLIIFLIVFFTDIKNPEFLKFLSIIVILPIAPLFFAVCFIVTENYMNFIGVRGFFGFERRPVLKFFFRISGIDRKDK